MKTYLDWLSAISGTGFIILFTIFLIALFRGDIL